jgi:CpXC protein
MSIFRPLAVTCPACKDTFEMRAVESVNADRRPDLRSAIVDRSFQVQSCPKCGEKFRLDPTFNYVDVARGQWLSIQPLEQLEDWIENEDEALATFALAYGDQAPEPAREIGNGLKPRLVFGWPAAREKIIANEHQLDDIALELMKLALIQSLDNSPLAPGNELRLETVEGDQIELGWVKAQNDEVVERIRVPREMYDNIVKDQEAWAEVRQKLETGPFVDMQKLYLGQGRPVAV